MKQSLSCVLLVAAVAAGGAQAKPKMIPLTDATGAALSGHTLTVTRHPRPSYAAMTAGKAMFGLFGAGAMIAAGNKIVDDNHVADPGDLVARELAPAIAKRYGMTLVPAGTPVITVDKPAQIAATQSGVDYILDVQSTGWMSAYYATDWDHYWIAYSVQIRLVDAKSRALVSNMACFSTTNKQPNPPTRDAMLANGAQLLKDVTAAHGWTCLHLLAKEQFLLADDAIAPTPAEYIDPLARYAGVAPAPVAASASDAVPAADAPAPDAPAADAPAADAPAADAPAADTAPAPATEAAPAAQAPAAADVPPADGAQ
jgi:hypothetical protein